MKSYWKILFLLGGLCTQVFAQGTMKITPGSHVVAKGDLYLVIKNCDWKNDGQFEADISNVQFSGTSEDSITGSNSSTFYNIELYKTGNGMVLGQEMEVENRLEFIAGTMDLNGFDLILLEANGKMVGENQDSRIIGPNGGEVVKTAVLSSPSYENPGNMGISISSAANLGTTTIRRGHVPQTLPGGTSIERYFTISPTHNAASTVRHAYFETELNGLDESNFESWHYDGGNWVSVTPDMTDTVSDYIESSFAQLGHITVGEALSSSARMEEGNDFTSDGMFNTEDFQVSTNNAHSVLNTPSDPFSDVDAQFEMQVYPNPTADIVQVRFENQSREMEASYRLFDLSGRIIDRGRLHTYDINPISLGKFPAGTYVLSVEQNGQTRSKRVVKMN